MAKEYDVKLEIRKNICYPHEVAGGLPSFNQMFHMNGRQHDYTSFRLQPDEKYRILLH